MKISKMLVCLFAVSLIGVVGCDKKDDENVKNVPDPAGTVTRSLRNSGIRLNSYNNEQRGTGLSFSDNVTWVAITSSNDFMCQNCSIASVGKVSGLGAVTKIPTSGFVQRNSVEPDCGYVIKCDDGTYARLYVVEWDVNTSNGIIGAKVKYQYPFEP